MSDEKWTPGSNFNKAWSFVKSASRQASRSSDPIVAVVLVIVVWLIYFPIVVVVFPSVRFIWFALKKIFR